MPDTLWGLVGPLLPPPLPQTARGNPSSGPHGCAGSEGAPVLRPVSSGGRGGAQLCPQAPQIPESRFRCRPSMPANAQSPGASLLPGCGSLPAPFSELYPVRDASPEHTHVLSSHPFKNNNRKGTFRDPTSFFSCCPSSSSETSLKKNPSPCHFHFLSSHS